MQWSNEMRSSSNDGIDARADANHNHSLIMDLADFILSISTYLKFKVNKMIPIFFFQIYFSQCLRLLLCLGHFFGDYFNHGGEKMEQKIVLR